MFVGKGNYLPLSFLGCSAARLFWEKSSLVNLVFGSMGTGLSSIFIGFSKILTLTCLIYLLCRFGRHGFAGPPLFMEIQIQLQKKKKKTLNHHNYERAVDYLEYFLAASSSLHPLVSAYKNNKSCQT